MIVKLPEIPDFTRPFALLMGSRGAWELKVARELEPYYGSIVLAANTTPTPLVLHTLRECVADAAVLVFWAGGASWQWLELGLVLGRIGRKPILICGQWPAWQAEEGELYLTRVDGLGIHVWEDLDHLISAAKAAREGGAR